MIHRRTALAALVAATAAAVLVSVAAPASSGAAGRKRGLRVDDLVSPCGISSGGDVVGCVAIPFLLTDRSRRAVRVEVEYAFDRNEDGVIADGSVAGLPSEFVTATVDETDARSTATVRRSRKGRVRTMFRPGGRDAEHHVFVWNERADLGRAVLTMEPRVLRTEEGRALYDPDDPGVERISSALGGVQIRLRAVRDTAGRPRRTAWVYSERFDVDGSAAPEARIDDVDTATVLGTAIVFWAVGDRDSEDGDGDGLLGPGEDVNGNGVLDRETVSAAFDWARLDFEQGPPMDDFEAAALTWHPCTPAPYGDGTIGLAAAGGGVLRSFFYVWDAASDVGSLEGEFALRVRPIDQHGKLGEAAYVGFPIMLVMPE